MKFLRNYSDRESLNGSILKTDAEIYKETNFINLNPDKIKHRQPVELPAKQPTHSFEIETKEKHFFNPE
jgi:hypothetical protein